MLYVNIYQNRFYQSLEEIRKFDLTLYRYNIDLYYYHFYFNTTDFQEKKNG